MNHVFKAKKNKVIEIMVINSLLLIPGIYLKQPLLFLVPIILLISEYISSKNYLKLVMNAKIDITGEGIDCNLVYDKINMKWSEIKHVSLERESGKLILIIENENMRKVIPMDIFNENELWAEVEKHVPKSIVDQAAIV